MSRNVWHKRFHGDALNGYMGLTLEQRGAYTTILDLLYDSDWAIGIPDRERWIAGHMNVSVRRWKGLREELIQAGKIDVVDGLISNKRYRIERENAASLSRKRSESGASGGEKSGEARKKASKINAPSEANASDLPLYTRATEAETEADKKKIGQHTTTPVEGAPVGADDVESWDAVSLADHVARVGGVRHLEPSRIASNISTVREWLDAGADPPMIANVVQAGRESARNGIHSLAYFDTRVRQAIANRDHPNDRNRTSIDTIRDPLLREYLANGGTLETRATTPG